MGGINILSNVSSLTAQRNLARTGNEIGVTFQRLSSGLRINTASDDAAGLAIADRLHADTRLYSTAKRNINDGFSVINIVNGAVDQQTQIINRLAELAQQSANGSYSDAQRASLSNEFRALVKEYGRTGDTTSFNGLNLLRGNRSNGAGDLVLQAGITSDISSQLTIKSGNTGTLSGVINLDAIKSADWLENDNAITVSDLFAYITYFFAGHTEEDLRNTYKNSLYNTEFLGADGIMYDVAVAFLRGSFFNQSPNRVGLHYFYKPKDQTNYTNSTGNLGVYNDGSFTVDPISGLATNVINSAVTIGGAVFNFDISGLQFQALGNAAGSGTALDFLGIENVTRSRLALDALTQKISELSSLRGQYGALESRLLSAERLVDSSKENTSAARARIVDADVGAESANLTRLKILQQAGAAVLGQANLQPRLALDLLRF